MDPYELDKHLGLCSAFGAGPVLDSLCIFSSAVLLRSCATKSWVCYNQNACSGRHDSHRVVVHIKGEGNMLIFRFEEMLPHFTTEDEPAANSSELF